MFLVMLSRVSKIRFPSSLKPLCMYSFVTHCLKFLTRDAVSWAMSKSTYLQIRAHQGTQRDSRTELRPCIAWEVHMLMESLGSHVIKVARGRNRDLVLP